MALQMTASLVDVTATDTFARQDCIYCGVVFYWPAFLDRRARYHARGFWCPGCGKSMVYRETEADRLRKELERERERLAAERTYASRQYEAAQAARRQATALKGVVTRTKRRIAAGKCVRCSCEFPDLAAHMAEAHPDYSPDDGQHG